MHEYLGLDRGRPMFRQDFTCPALLKDNECSTRTGLSPAMAELSRSFRFIPHCHWPGPRSLATTSGVSFDVLSSGYLDVSVPRVRFLHPMYSGEDTLLLIARNLFSCRLRRRTAARAATAGQPCGAPLRSAQNRPTKKIF